MIYAVIVVYNKSCADSLTIQFIQKYNSDKIRIIVFDNSTKDFKNRSYADNRGFTYYSFNENRGLSKAYNYAIEQTKTTEKDYFIILDDDTELNNEYLDEVVERCEENRYKILLPKVYSSGILLSPSRFKAGCYPKRENTIEKLKNQKLTAINSGMVVKADIFKSVKYNEALFLDYVDHEFMLRINQLKIEIDIMNARINQNFSAFERSSLESALFRYNIFKKDIKTYSTIIGKPVFYYYCMLRHTVKQVLKYKSIRFIKCFLFDM